MILFGKKECHKCFLTSRPTDSAYLGGYEGIHIDSMNCAICSDYLVGLPSAKRLSAEVGSQSTGEVILRTNVGCESGQSNVYTVQKQATSLKS